MATTSLPKAKRLRNARTLALKEAMDRYNHEILGVEERLMLLQQCSFRLSLQTQCAMRLSYWFSFQEN